MQFSDAVTLSNPSGVTVIGRTTTNTGFIVDPIVYHPTSVTQTDADTLQIAFAPGLLPDQTCYTISLASNTVAESLTGDLDVKVRSLVGDATGDGTITLSDAIYVQSVAAASIPVAAAPRCDLDLNGDISLQDALAAKLLVITPASHVSCP